MVGHLDYTIPQLATSFITYLPLQPSIQIKTFKEKMVGDMD
jgi:hypothetical protein